MNKKTHKSISLLTSKEKLMNELVDKIENNSIENKFTLNLLENMRDHSERYLRGRVSHFYDKIYPHNYSDKDVNYLRFINQNHYGMVVHDYFPSKPFKKNHHGQRGMIKLIVDSSIGTDFYNLLIKRKFIVIKTKLSLTLQRESNMEGDEVELEWKNCEDSSLDKMAVKSVWYNPKDPPTEDEPVLELFNEALSEYYKLDDMRMYTKSHSFYHFVIIDNQETSNDFIVRLYDLLVKHYGRFEHKTCKEECDCIYLNTYIPIYGEENDIPINEVDTNGFYCSNALKKKHNC
jgi:hypothetical protein